MDRGFRGSGRQHGKAGNVQWIRIVWRETVSAISFAPVLCVHRCEFLGLKSVDVSADFVVHGDCSKEFTVYGFML